MIACVIRVKLRTPAAAAFVHVTIKLTRNGCHLLEVEAKHACCPCMQGRCPHLSILVHCSLAAAVGFAERATFVKWLSGVQNKVSEGMVPLAELELRPDGFCAYLTDVLSFIFLHELVVPQSSTGFDRPIWVLQRGWQ